MPARFEGRASGDGGGATSGPIRAMRSCRSFMSAFRAASGIGVPVSFRKASIWKKLPIIRPVSASARRRERSDSKPALRPRKSSAIRWPSARS